MGFTYKQNKLQHRALQSDRPPSTKKKDNTKQQNIPLWNLENNNHLTSSWHTKWHIHKSCSYQKQLGKGDHYLWGFLIITEQHICAVSTYKDTSRHLIYPTAYGVQSLTYPSLTETKHFSPLARKLFNIQQVKTSVQKSDILIEVFRDYCAAPLD
jgi:hypothetical protein